jgi:hypothetical protein
MQGNIKVKSQNCCYSVSKVKYYVFGIQKRNVLNSRCLVEEFHPNINMLLFVMSLRMKLISGKTLLPLNSGDPDFRAVIVPTCGFRGYQLRWLHCLSAYRILQL